MARRAEAPVKAVIARINTALKSRAARGMKRSLTQADPSSADFSSNDYLGLARSQELVKRINHEVERVEKINRHRGTNLIGATGSRLLSGNTWYHASVEQWMASFFQRESALLFNSGYDLNLGLLSCLPVEGDVVLFDELVHNSTIMGMRCGRKATPVPFRHNCLSDLAARLQELSSSSQSGRGEAGSPGGGLVFVVVEAVYSMEGDVAPLADICRLAAQHGACVIVDEAHSTGVLGPQGRGLVCREGLQDHPALLGSVHTFGKALGCHGAVFCGPREVREYLVNYCFPFIYSTALAFHSVATARVACEFQAACDDRRAHLARLIATFQEAMHAHCQSQQEGGMMLLPSDTPIQAFVLPGNDKVTAVAAALVSRGYDVRPLRSPTVRKGSERLRIILHHHNSTEEVVGLARSIGRLIGSTETTLLDDVDLDSSAMQQSRL